MYSAAKSHVVSVLGPPPTRYAVHMTLELNRTASTAEQLNSLLTQIMENFSVSDHEGPLTDEVEAFLNEQEHLTVRRHGDTVHAGMVPFCPFRFFTFRVAGTNFPVRVEVK